MKLYDVPCPVCGSVNYDVDLQDTDGLLMCGCCHTELRVLSLRPLRVIPSSGKERTHPFFWGRIAML